MKHDYAKLAIEVLTAMYEHNSKSSNTVGRTELGPHPLTSEQVANDIRVIYNELLKD